ncbi:MAG: ATP-binding cassette domain-containing protein [Candidatus Peregrinibacteria bacterium]|nr:ATP-binding cassette domain-containing protein [Candidatus Peregrinibacteria bacterium]
MIFIDRVTKKFGNKKVLDSVSFNVDGGEFVCITGHSGAGKTTLIHAIIGAEKINAGNIFMDNFEVNKLKGEKLQSYRRKIGIVFQDYKLLAQKTVFENVAFSLEVSGYPKDFVQKRVTEVLKLTGLEELRNSFPREISGGEKQRVAIARALVHAPQLLIADEPTGNLDPENALALAELLLKINKSGTTILLSTHNKDVITRVKKRVITLKEGKIISDK